jgi:c-di-GMP-binding flagellar brake protein YcgR
MPQKRNARKKERRATARADARLSMRLEGARDDGDLTQVVTESQNISASGVYCLSPHYLAPLSKVDLAIVLPRLPGGRGAKEIISCEGIVVRCDAGTERSDRHFQLACMFTGLDPKRRQRIEEFVTWRNLQALRAATGASRRGPAKGRANSRATGSVRKATSARTGRARAARSRRETVH